MKNLLLIVLLIQPCIAEDYWSAFWSLAAEVELCADQYQVNSFLAQAYERRGNAEKAEADSEVVGKLIMNNSRCFVDAINSYEQRTCKGYYSWFVVNSIIIEPSKLAEILKTEAMCN